MLIKFRIALFSLFVSFSALTKPCEEVTKEKWLKTEKVEVVSCAVQKGINVKKDKLVVLVDHLEENSQQKQLALKFFAKVDGGLWSLDKPVMTLLGLGNEVVDTVIDKKKKPQYISFKDVDNDGKKEILMSFRLNPKDEELMGLFCFKVDLRKKRIQSVVPPYYQKQAQKIPLEYNKLSKEFVLDIQGTLEVSDVSTLGDISYYPYKYSSPPDLRLPKPMKRSTSSEE